LKGLYLIGTFVEDGIMLGLSFTDGIFLIGIFWINFMHPRYINSIAGHFFISAVLGSGYLCMERGAGAEVWW
jgi:hypothetical protein